MAISEPRAQGRSRFLNRVQAWLATRRRPRCHLLPDRETRGFGRPERGQALLDGHYHFAGDPVDAPGRSIWDAEVPDAGFRDALQGFDWVEDLATLGDKRARLVAQDWITGWLQRYGNGSGPGWTPVITGRRVLRCMNHASFLTRALEPAETEAFCTSLAQQLRFLARRWPAAAPGLPRIEALAGLICGAAGLSGQASYLGAAGTGLDRELQRWLSPEGTIPGRNPEDLLQLFTLLIWCRDSLGTAGEAPSETHVDAIARIAPVLRSLRHADGTLARFHGGDQGPPGRLDRMLSASGVTQGRENGLAMGFARLAAGRTSVIVDAAAPPSGRDSHRAHASCLAFELTSGRRPLIVNCGAGQGMGHDWHRAGRAGPSHSTLVLDGMSSSRLSDAGGAALDRGPRHVPTELKQGPEGTELQVAHDGFLRACGLTHARILDLTFDGRALAGEDLLLATGRRDKKRFDKALNARGDLGIPYQVRFHLHPDVIAVQDGDGRGARLGLASGEAWHFTHDGKARLSVEASVYVEKGWDKPVQTKQLVLSGRAMGYATRIRWSFAKAKNMPVSLRDLVGVEDVDQSELT